MGFLSSLDPFSSNSWFKNPLKPIIGSNLDPIAALGHTGGYGAPSPGPYSAGYLNPKTNPYGLPWGLVGTGGKPYPGVSGLLDLLNNPGQTDPRALAQGVQGAAQASQQQQQDATGSLAARGLGGGGFSDMVHAAIGQGGANQIGGLYQQNAQNISDKQRSDLMSLLGGVVQGGKLNYRQVLGGINAAQAQQGASNQQAGVAGGAALLGLIAALAA